MFGIGWQELLLIFIIVLLLFGAKRLPEIAQGLGKGIREFKRAIKDSTEEVKGSLDNEGTRDYNRAKQGERPYDRPRDDRPKDDRPRDDRPEDRTAGDRRDDRPEERR